MTRSSSEEAVKSSHKRKGTRSVSTLTQAQLERKRANDREAQRAIRARTKEHIERLEKEVEELKARDPSYMELRQENRALRDEIGRLKDKQRHLAGTSYPNTAYEESLNSVSGAVPSPRSSPFPTPGTYSGMAELGPSYVPLPESSEAWGPGVSVPVSSTVSSPSSSANTDEYGAPAYIPTSIPAPLMEARSVPTKMEYDDMDSDTSYSLHPHPPRSHQHPHSLPVNDFHMPQEPWNTYPTLYYQQPSAH